MFLPEFYRAVFLQKIFSRAVFLSGIFSRAVILILPGGLFFTTWSTTTFTGSKLTAVWPVNFTGRFNRLVAQKLGYFRAGQYYSPIFDFLHFLFTNVVLKYFMSYVGTFLPGKCTIFTRIHLVNHFRQYIWTSRTMFSNWSFYYRSCGTFLFFLAFKQQYLL